MDNKQTTIFNVLLSCLILIILSIYILTINNTPGRIPIAKVNNMMIYDKDINYYLSTLFGSDGTVWNTSSVTEDGDDNLGLYPYP